MAATLQVGQHPNRTQSSTQPNLAHPAAETHPRGIPGPRTAASARTRLRSSLRHITGRTADCSGSPSAAAAAADRSRRCGAGGSGCAACLIPCRGTAPGAIASAFDPHALGHTSRTSRPAVCRPAAARGSIGPTGPVENDTDRRPVQSRAGSGRPAATGRGPQLSALPAAGGAAPEARGTWHRECAAARPERSVNSSTPAVPSPSHGCQLELVHAA